LLFSSCCLAQANDPAIVTVHAVQAGNQQAPEGTLIEAVDASGAIVAQGRTDRNGEAVMGRLEPGCYRFRRANMSAADGSGTCTEVGTSAAPILKEVYINEIGTSGPAVSTEGMVSAVSLAAPESAKSELARAAAAIDKQQLGEAEKRAKKALKSYPDYPEAHNLLGNVYLRSGELSSARKAFRDAIKADPKFVDGYRNLARIAGVEGDFAEAERQLDLALRADPNDSESWTLLAFAQFARKQYDATLRSAERAHAFDAGKAASAHFVAASALEKQGRISDAMNQLRTYLEEEANGRYAARSRELLKRYAARTR
jgi:Tfp pilus assembly protein PilF